jgi:hypothetical protein
MQNIIRHSPISFGSQPLQTETRDHWEVILEYEDEGQGPHLVDLSHRQRWDMQDGNLSQYQPFDHSIPESPNLCSFRNGVLVNRMNRTQAAIWHLAGQPAGAPEGEPFSETTDATLMLALFDKNAFAITEKLTSLDFSDSVKQPPFLSQGPFAHVPCQIVTLANQGDQAGIVFTCSRGYGRDMVHAVLTAGQEFGLRPAGEKAFLQWIETIAGN